MLKKILEKYVSSAYRQKIYSNLFWSLSGKLVNLLGSLFVGILVTRYLGPEQFGLMNYVISYVMLFQILASFGLDSIEIREEARNKEEYNRYVGTAFYTKLALAAAVFILCVGTSLFLEADRFTTCMVALYSLSMMANCFSVIRNYFMAIVDNEYIVKSEMARVGIGALIKVLLIIFDAGLTWFIAATTFDTLLVAGGYLMSYIKKIGSPGAWTFDIKTAVFLLKESFPLMLTSAAVVIYQRIDQVMIGQILNNSAVGLFSVAARIVDIIIYIPFVLSDTLTPVLVSTREKSEEEYRSQAQRFINISFWSTFLIALITSAASKWILLLLFGQQYIEATPVLAVLAFKSVTVALSSSAGKMLIIEGLQKWAILRDITGCIICVSLNLILLPHYGILAAAVIAILSNLAAGYLSDAFIPAYRHIFVRQTKVFMGGWKDLTYFLKQNKQ
ncbi:MAG: flippase [Prevotella sp.]|uniref:flippase n=1 Tax=Prevotella sp. TaxID=59823 RepID=UPI002A2B7508|nr:flippase [Prevotella sp.]MDD7318616.1 flippase [Prevotellaceae bacterium]MDY4019428.1 flippase [Prevotella sp.]